MFLIGIMMIVTVVTLQSTLDGTTDIYCISGINDRRTVIAPWLISSTGFWVRLIYIYYVTTAYLKACIISTESADIELHLQRFKLNSYA